MSNCAAANKRLGHFVHLDRGHHAGECVLALKRVLERDCIEHSGEHAHVIGRGTVKTLRGKCQSAKNVSSADDYGDFDAKLVHVINFAGDASDGCGIDSIALLSHQSFAGKFEQYSLIDCF